MLELTGGTFDKALLSKGKIFAKEGRWAMAREMLKAYSRKNAGDRSAGDLVSSAPSVCFDLANGGTVTVVCGFRGRGRNEEGGPGASREAVGRLCRGKHEGAPDGDTLCHYTAAARGLCARAGRRRTSRR